MDENTAGIAVVLVFVAIIIGILIYTEGQRNSRGVCERMLIYEHDMTKQQANEAYRKELEREGKWE